MSSPRALARLALGGLAAAGIITVAVQLAEHADRTAAQAGAPSAVVEAARPGSGYGAARPVTVQGARRALEGTLGRPGGSEEPELPVPVPLADTRGLVPGRELGQLHLDPVPEGASLSDATDTASLYERARLDPELVDALTEDPATSELSAAADEAVPAQATAATVPPGTPSTKGLTEHVTPSCSGTGTDGNRVQVLYVRETGTPSRFASVLPLLRNEIANVDDVFAVSARETGGERRVRWVHSGCVPVITEVEVPTGTLDGGIDRLVTALQERGFDNPRRKYLSFAEARALCGIGTLYLDTNPTGNWNDGVRASYSRVDAPCWSYAGHSVAAHELTHNLGGVQRTAPHATSFNHCSDDYDLMCYADGSGTPMQLVCASSHEQLLDCNGDDYFNTNPKAGSYLATSWNTARSSFLDTVTVPPPTVTVSASTTRAETGDAVTVTATASSSVRYRWSASQPCALTGATAAKLGVLCPATVTGPVALAVTATDSSGRTASASATVEVVRAAAPTVSVVAPSAVAAGGSTTLAATPVGKAPFTYAWTTDGPCTVPASTTAAPRLSCPTGSTGQTTTVALSVTQADGQQGQAVPVPVSVTEEAPAVAPVPTATTWSMPGWSANDPRVLSGVLRATSGQPVGAAPVRLESRPDASHPWRVVATGLVTDANGRVRVRASRSVPGWYRFTYAGSPPATSGEPATGTSTSTPTGTATGPMTAPSASAAVFGRARVGVSATWRNGRHLLQGRLVRADGTPVARVPVLVQRRFAGSSRWVTVATVRSSAEGRLSVSQRPGRAAYLRWVYQGDDRLMPARSTSVRVR